MNDYFAIDAVNWSTLRWMAESPAHYRAKLNMQSRTTPALNFGTAVHMACLEPERYPSEVVCYRQSKTKGEGARKNWAAFKKANEGKLILSGEEYDSIEKLMLSVCSHPVAKELLSRGEAEKVLEWRDPGTGVACKAKLDWVSDDVIVDLKTARCNEERRFGSTAARYLYHCQAAFYRHAVRCALGKDLPVKLIVVEKEEPYDCSVFDVRGEDMDGAMDHIKQLLGRVLSCRTSGDWPGRSEQELTLMLPSWGIGVDYDYEWSVEVG